MESFFERFDNPFVLSRMTGPHADVREAELLQKLSDIARMKVDAEPLGDDALEIDPSPADNAVLLTIGAGLDDPGEFSPLARSTGATSDPRSSCRGARQGPRR